VKLTVTVYAVDLKSLVRAVQRVAQDLMRNRRSGSFDDDRSSTTFEVSDA
jgi:hypothetical protein